MLMVVFALKDYFLTGKYLQDILIQRFLVQMIRQETIEISFQQNLLTFSRIY